VSTEFEVNRIAGANPPLKFLVRGDTIRAELDGAKLYAEVCDKGADLRLTAADGGVLADLIVRPFGEGNLTENVVDVGAALMWSHWRFVQLETAAAEVSP
jgi:hypothetical protein